jgi:Family of unknown function (DUF6174)
MFVMNGAAADGNRAVKSADGTSQAWVWFFVVLALLAVTAVGVSAYYNSQQRVTVQKLEAARTLWDANGPRDYDLTLTKQGGATGRFRVYVRNGKVVLATMDARPVEARLYNTLDMPALFDDIQTFLEIDSKPNSPRTFTRGVFDPADGHVVQYVRRVTASQQRVQIDVELKRVDPGSPVPE